MVFITCVSLVLINWFSNPTLNLNVFQEAQVYADDNSLLFLETSAKTALNVNEVFMAIGKGIIVIIIIIILFTLVGLGD